MTNVSRTKKIICVALAAILCASALIISMNVKADMVTVSKSVNPQLEFAKVKADYATIDGAKRVFEDSDGSYEESGDESSRRYTIKTNSFACWYDGDQVDYAYLKIPFNYRVDDEATVTAEVTLNSWSAFATTASAGILLRSSLNGRASMALAHARPEAMLMVSRTETGKACNSNLNYKEPPRYDNGIRLRMTFVTTGKGVGKVKSEYNFTPSNPKSWVTIQSGVFVKFDKDIYIGLGASSTERSDLATAVFSDFNVEVTAYEGYQLDEDPDNPSSSSSSSSSSEVTLPPDIPPTEDILLKETFTDGSMFDGEESVENPIWQTTASETTVETNKDKTNRYLAITPVSDGLWFAGSTDWTDYSVSCDITFPSDISLTNTNTFGLIGRLKYNKLHGISSYSAVLSSKTQTIVEDVDGTQVKHTKIIQTLTLGYANMMTDKSKAYQTALKTVTLNYLDAEDPEAYDLILSGKKNNLRMDLLDNTIKIYWNDEEVISYVDDLSENTNANRIEIPAYGNIGIYGSNVTVNVDNITVRKLEDPLGGDFDNFIGGRWNEPISKELYQYYIDNKISFY